MKARKQFWLVLLTALILGFAGIIFYFNSVQTIQQETFVKFYADYLVAQDSLGNDVASSKKIRESLYKKYNVTEEAYLSTINKYNHDEKEWAVFFGKVMKELETRRDKLKTKR